jgi:hypothetical protein
MIRFGYIFTIIATLYSPNALAQWDFSGDIELEIRYFPENPAYAGQKDSTLSPATAFQPEIVYEWNEGLDRLTFEPYFRVDVHDSERTHVDICEGSYLHIGETWDTTIGISRVFWGVTESVHLVDIINQTDGVEDIDIEDKLGQPMLNFNWYHTTGDYSFFILPGFRARTFPGDDARRRGPFPIDAHRVTYDSGAEENHVDFAFRWFRTIGDWDIAISDFYGTSREARFIPRMTATGAAFRPHYDIIHQIGTEVQYTKNAWLWKFEGISRTGHGDQFFAAVGGFEYSFYQIFDTNADLGLLLEYQYDGRDTDGTAPFTISDNDIFAGARLALNNEASSAVLIGGLFDHENHTVAAQIEGEHRVNEYWKAQIEARLFLHTDHDDPLIAIYKDDSINFKMTYSF